MARGQRVPYRQGAEDALGRLDWCIGYLHGINGDRIAAAQAENRAYIRRSLLREAAEPVPSQWTSESRPLGAARS